MQIDTRQHFWLYDVAGEVGDCADCPVYLPAESYHRVKDSSRRRPRVFAI
jgi:hypothetical protein